MGNGFLRNLEDLPGAIEEAKRRNTQPVPPPPSRMLDLVAQAIEKLLNQKKLASTVESNIAVDINPQTT